MITDKIEEERLKNRVMRAKIFTGYNDVCKFFNEHKDYVMVSHSIGRVAGEYSILVYYYVYE